MGLLGLRRFVDATGCTQLLSVPLREDEDAAAKHSRQQSAPAPSSSAGPHRRTQPSPSLTSSDEASQSSSSTADHVLVDLNCIVHACFPSSGNTEQLNKTDIIHAVLHRLEVLITRVVVPKRTLTICLDGPAPLAKLQTQRLRRRKVVHMDSSSSSAAGHISSLDVTAGSLFMVELENAIAASFKSCQGRGAMRELCPVFLHGTTVAGEGEAKISRALAYLAYGPGRHPSGVVQQQAGYYNDGPPPYSQDDTIVILGNDIDLTLTGLGATFYHNISVVSPASLQCISVGDMLYRWITASSTSGSSVPYTVEQLPTLRIDFTFLFLLNGGDHYVGAGDIAMTLWQRYRVVRGAYPNQSLVSASLDSVDPLFLADVLQADDYVGEANTDVGMHLLQSALWSLQTTINGVCPNYRYLPPLETVQVTLSHLRAAAKMCKAQRRRIQFSQVADTAPLTPLEHYIALMPTTAALPRSVSGALLQPSLRGVAQVLLTSNDPSEVAVAAEKAAEAASSFLSASECYLRQFTSPVQLNVCPPRPRRSRHEEHRLLALASKNSGGRRVTLPPVPDPLPVVRVVVLPEEAPVTPIEYPSGVKSLRFRLPFSSVERSVAFGAAAAAAPAAPVRGKLDHGLAIAERLKAGGQSRAAEGNKMRKRLRKAEAEVHRMVQEASEEQLPGEGRKGKRKGDRARRGGDGEGELPNGVMDELAAFFKDDKEGMNHLLAEERKLKNRKLDRRTA